MGTPETKEKSNPHLPLIATKIKLLKFAWGLRPEITKENIAGIFEGMKTILLPVVSSFDRPLAKLKIFHERNIPEALQKCRAMIVYDGFGCFLNIALDRSGDWFIEGKDEKTRVRKVTTSKIASIILENINEFVEEFLMVKHSEAFEEWRASQEKLAFLKDLFQYSALLNFISKCQVTITKTIEEHEKRIRELRERLVTFNDFESTLDLVKTDEHLLVLPGFSIWHKDSHESSRQTDGYFTQEDLNPFWQKIGGVQYAIWVVKKSLLKSGYFEHNDTEKFTSLRSFVEKILYKLGDIHKGRKRTGGEIQLGTYNSRRLPFSDAEIKVLRELVESLF